MSSIDTAISFTASSPVTGNTGCAAGPPPDPSPEPCAGVAVAVAVARGAGVAGFGCGTELDGAVDPDGSAPGRNDECESECEAKRIATLSNATVSVTRRLNRITSTRNALVCTG